MAESGNVPVIRWGNTNKTEGNYQPQVDYVKSDKESKAEQLANTSIFTYAASYKS